MTVRRELDHTHKCNSCGHTWWCGNVGCRTWKENVCPPCYDEFFRRCTHVEERDEKDKK